MEKMEDFFSVKVAKLRRITTKKFSVFPSTPSSGPRGSFQFSITPEIILLIGILLLSAFLRLYKISDYMTFLGDEGRDVLVAYDILHGNLTLLGPRSSAADFFYGPIYYYLITPFLLLFNYDPVGPAVMVALIGIATVYLVYKFGKEFMNISTGLFASALYAASPLVISYSRSSWNPNPLPFVSLLSLYLLCKYIRYKSLKPFLVIGILLGIAMQFQYLALFLGAIIAVYIFIGTVYIFGKYNLFLLTKRYLVIFAGFVVGFSPFLAFEIKHGFPNLRTILQYIFTNDLDPVDAETKSFLPTFLDLIFRLFGRLITRFPPPEQVNVGLHGDVFVWYIATIALAITSLAAIVSIKNKRVFLLLSTWLVLGVGLFTLYKDKIFDYHFGFMFPLPFFLAGNLFSWPFQVKKWQPYVGRFLGGLFLILFIFLFAFNLQGNPFRYLPNRQKDQVKKISDFVLSKTNAEPFNFALLTLGNSDHAYRYFFKIAKSDPVILENPEKDPQRQSVTDQLLIVCEDSNCQPLGASLWEVAGFGRAEIVGEWQVSVVKVYKLVHYRGP